MDDDGRAGTLWLTTRPRNVPDGDIDVVIDLRWTPPGPGSAVENEVRTRPRSLRDAAGRVLARLDPIEATSGLLDDWAAVSGVVDTLTVGSTSFWFRVRLSHWLWLQEHVLWAALLRELIAEHRPAALSLGPGTDAALRRVAGLVASTDGLPLHVEGEAAGTPFAAGLRAYIRPIAGRGWRATGRLLAAVRRRMLPRRGRRGTEAPPERLDRLAGERGAPLLVVLTQLPHRIETPAGPRVMNPYLGPLVDRLHGTPLDPVVVDRYPERAQGGEGRDRVLSLGVLRGLAPGPDAAATAAARAAAATIRQARFPAIVAGIDLGPALAQHVADDAARWLADAPVAVERWYRLAERLGARGFLLADEYHRQDCLEAAARLGVPVVAVQHGTIYRRHNGYVHRRRPAALRLPTRTYVFGRWERDLLVGGSVYRDDEVVVGGSPRQDLFRPASVDREAARAELGVLPGERLIVLSGTYGTLYRRFHYPLLLARLFDRRLPGVRLVVKQHPAEPDEGPYRAVIEGVAAAGGFEPPPIAVLRDVDLYHVLAAADAHLGIHSTVLTEAVFVGTPNLLATGVLGGDLLDYEVAGVAVPVATGADLLDALDAVAAGAITAAAREAFIAAHYEPGAASQRIADDLVAWLA